MEKLPMLNNDKQLILEFFLFLLYQACFKRKVTANLLKMSLRRKFPYVYLLQIR